MSTPRRNLLLLAALFVAAIPLSCGVDAHVAAALELGASATGGEHRVAHRGVRIVTTLDRNRSNEHVERVYDGGATDVGLSLLSVNGGAPGALASALFAIEARNLHEFRDVHITGVDRVLENYDVSVVPGSNPIAGRTTMHLRFQARRTPIGPIDLWIDAATGLPLAVEKRSAAGATDYRMRYTEIEIGRLERGPDDPPPLASPSTPASDHAALSFAPLPPTWIPDGFESIDRDVVQLPTDSAPLVASWERFSDGLEQIFVVQGDAADPLWGDLPAADGPDGHLSFATFERGPLHIVGGIASGRALFAFGRLPQEDLGALLAGYASESR